MSKKNYDKFINSNIMRLGPSMVGLGQFFKNINFNWDNNQN